MKAPSNAPSSPAAATEQKEQTLRQRLRGRLGGLVPWRRVAAPPRHRACPTPKVSIVIPMHGTAATLEKCVLSAMNQSLEEIEIVCVDDASPDDCAEIVRRLARRDARIQLIRHEHNRGLGGARNSGIHAARATYVSGIDSDDFILPEMMQRLWEASEDGRADVVACGFTRVHADGSPAAASYQPEPGWFSNDAQQLDIFEFLNPSFCNKIWRRSLFTDNDILFPEHTYFEDLAVTPLLISKARHVRVIEGAYYMYFVRPGSITRSHSSRHIIDHFRVFDILDRFLEQQGLQRRYGHALVERIGRSLAFHASEVIASELDEHDKRQYLRTCLMLQIGYLRFRDQLRDSDAEELQSLIQAAHSPAALAALLERQQDGPVNSRCGEAAHA